MKGFNCKKELRAKQKILDIIHYLDNEAQYFLSFGCSDQIRPILTRDEFELVRQALQEKADRIIIEEIW